MASIKDVATAAGVSTATVSRVLANKPHIRAEVRSRVLAAVNSLEYRPNLVARNLRSQQSTTLGLIVSDIRNPFFSAISRAVEDTAYVHGFNVLLCNTDENHEREALYLQVMQDENVAGIIVSPTEHLLARLSSTRPPVPMVLIDRAMKNSEIDAVLLDNAGGAYTLTSHLVAQGYQRIAAIFGLASTTGRERQRGYEDALREYGRIPSAARIKYVQPRRETGQLAAVDLLAASHPPDAIITGNGLLTAGALQALHEKQLVVPDDVALVGFDETSWSTLVQPGITVLAQPTDEIGKTAIELLLQRIGDPRRATRQVILQGELRVRGSSTARSIAMKQE